MKLEEDHWDWSRPLARGNYRAPGCAYCHLHTGEHDTHLSVTSWTPFKVGGPGVQEALLGWRQAVCGECHAPRYVAEQTHTGLHMIEVAHMKLRETREVITRYQGVLPAENRFELDTLLIGMQSHGLNVRLGVSHQSPDYQWWHGQPALDGDLLRIKGLIGDRERGRELARESHPGK